MSLDNVSDSIVNARESISIIMGFFDNEKIAEALLKADNSEYVKRKIIADENESKHADSIVGSIKHIGGPTLQVNTSSGGLIQLEYYIIDDAVIINPFGLTRRNTPDFMIQVKGEKVNLFKQHFILLDEYFKNKNEIILNQNRSEKVKQLEQGWNLKFKDDQQPIGSSPKKQFCSNERNQQNNFEDYSEYLEKFKGDIPQDFSGENKQIQIEQLFERQKLEIQIKDLMIKQTSIILKQELIAEQDRLIKNIEAEKKEEIQKIEEQKKREMEEIEAQKKREIEEIEAQKQESIVQVMQTKIKQMNQMEKTLREKSDQQSSMILENFRRYSNME